MYSFSHFCSILFDFIDANTGRLSILSKFGVSPITTRTCGFVWYEFTHKGPQHFFFFCCLVEGLNYLTTNSKSLHFISQLFDIFNIHQRFSVRFMVVFFFLLKLCNYYYFLYFKTKPWVILRVEIVKSFYFFFNNIVLYYGYGILKKKKKTEISAK